MKLRHRFLLICRGVALISCASAQVADHANRFTQLTPGVVIEKVAKNSEAEKVGLQAGDILLSWVRADARGQIESPFDLGAIEIEQAPRGNVTLEGLRGAKPQTWTVGPDAWGIHSRPNLQGKLLEQYQESQELAAAQEFSMAELRWQAVEEEAQKSPIAWLSPWLRLQAAQALDNKSRLKEADRNYQRAVQMAGETASQFLAQLLRAWADSFQKRNDWESAEKYYSQSASMAEKSEGVSLAMALSLYRLGLVAYKRGDPAKAEDYLNRSLEIRQKLAPGSLPVAASLNVLGNVAWDRADLVAADERYHQALSIRLQLAPQGPAIAGTFIDLGRLAWRRGNLTEAEQYDRRSLEIRQKLSPGSLDVASSSMNLGIVAFERRDLATAEEYFNQALDIQQKLAPDTVDVAMSCNNLGILAIEQGDFAAAEEYYRRALKIGRKLAPFSLGFADGLANLAILEDKRGNLVASERYHRQALNIRRNLAPFSLDTAESFQNLGDLRKEQGDLAAAKHYYDLALPIAEKLSPEGPLAATTLQRLGEVDRELHKPLKAEQYLRRALAIWAKLSPGSSDYAESSAALATILRDQRQTDVAANQFARALDALETQTARLGGSQQSRSEFRAYYSDYYNDYIDLLIQQNQPEEAFHVAERFRARSLLETLAAAHVDIHQGADSELVQREHTLQAALNVKRDRRVALLTGRHTTLQVEAVEKEIAALRGDYEVVESRIRAASPAYAALTQPLPLTARQVQQLLDDDTLLLEYSLGKERSYVWALTSNSLAVYKLPSRTIIEAAARRLHKEISALGSTETTLGESSRQRQNRLAIAASALSHAVVGPVAGELKKKRLVVIAEGALQYVPFAVLPQPGKPNGLPLLLQHEIVYSPSASVVAELRRDANGRSPAPKTVAILADPVFDQEDPRVNAKGAAGMRTARRGTPPLFAQRITRSATDLGLAHLSRLAFSRREADAIMALIPAGQGMEATGFDANRATATSPDLAQYRVVHFATHALSDNQHPEFSGLVLSMVNAQGKPQNGFFDLQDIYNLNLPVELVVLSGCETALGKAIQGEGIVGLTRGFMYAGAVRVMATLWNVDDESSKQLMEKFYYGMEREGMSPAAALRSAQMAMWKQRRWRDAHDWAAFQLQGEWR